MSKSGGGSYRARLMRAVHAEGLKRGFDHEGLRAVCRERWGVASMREATDRQLAELYHAWTGKGLRRQTPLPRKGVLAAPAEELVSGEDLNTLAEAFARRGWGPETQRAFIKRQTRGREQIRTRKDFWRVFSGLRAMERRGTECRS